MLSIMMLPRLLILNQIIHCQGQQIFFVPSIQQFCLRLVLARSAPMPCSHTQCMHNTPRSTHSCLNLTILQWPLGTCPWVPQTFCILEHYCTHPTHHSQWMDTCTAKHQQYIHPTHCFQKDRSPYHETHPCGEEVAEEERAGLRMEPLIEVLLNR